MRICICTICVFQWNLVCDNAVLAETSQSVFAVGLMVGAVLFCTLGDHFGRKPVFVLSHILLVVMGVAQALVQDYASFMVMRFFNGAVQQVILIASTYDRLDCIETEVLIKNTCTNKADAILAQHLRPTTTKS